MENGLPFVWRNHRRRGCASMRSVHQIHPAAQIHQIHLNSPESDREDCYVPTTENPFRPTAGATPPEVIGRSGLLDEFEYGLELGSGAPGLLSIFTGARGIGKTVMLGAAHDVARQHGWAVIAEVKSTGVISENPC